MINRASIIKPQSEVTTREYAGANKNTTLDKDDFLKLFMTQLRYQDPTQPLDIFQMSQQLAQFSTVEQLYNIKEELADIKGLLGESSYAQMASLIGKDIEASGNTLELKDGRAGLITLDLDKKADVTVDIFDGDGNLIKVLNLPNQEPGKFNVFWDGTAADGAQVPDGTYQFFATAADGNNNSVKVRSRIAGTVEGVKKTGNDTYLILSGGDALVNLKNVEVIGSVSGEEAETNF